ncbi:MAG: tetratricopeptide repeat protein [Proteobacteria bacterium]|nr:tetratricopeptide repeat protein [Pseudomonadota bacterium]MBS0492943.1 tetratricopeptide repeat protein [Pseudomonadota bacterium]
MTSTYPVPTPLEYFAALVQAGPGDAIALLEAAACIAHDDYPDLDVQQLLDDMDRLQARLARRIPEGAEPLQRLNALNRFFYGELGFGANLNDYYAPDNSYPHVVLRTRRGIPISLALLWLELAQGVGLDAHGISFPGHFLVKVLLPGGQAVLDPVTGHALSREALSERLEPFRQRQGAVQEEVPMGLFLQAASARDMLARMLRNLKEIHRMRQDWRRLVAVQDRLITLLPDAWDEWRDRGLAYAALGQPPQALSDLETYLAQAPEAGDAQEVELHIKALRGR